MRKCTRRHNVMRRTIIVYKTIIINKLLLKKVK